MKPKLQLVKPGTVIKEAPSFDEAKAKRHIKQLRQKLLDASVDYVKNAKGKRAVLFNDVSSLSGIPRGLIEIAFNWKEGA